MIYICYGLFSIIVFLVALPSSADSGPPILNIKRLPTLNGSLFSGKVFEIEHPKNMHVKKYSTFSLISGIEQAEATEFIKEYVDGKIVRVSHMPASAESYFTGEVIQTPADGDYVNLIAKTGAEHFNNGSSHSFQEGLPWDGDFVLDQQILHYEEGVVISVENFNLGDGRKFSGEVTDNGKSLHFKRGKIKQLDGSEKVYPDLNN